MGETERMGGAGIAASFSPKAAAGIGAGTAVMGVFIASLGLVLAWRSPNHDGDN